MIFDNIKSPGYILKLLFAKDRDIQGGTLFLVGWHATAAANRVISVRQAHLPLT